jgi:Uncharacterized conserved protein
MIMKGVIDPDSRIADLVGLLYTLTNIFNGKTDLYMLGKEMEVDVDDLMPIVYTASLLNFVKLENGDISITEKGTEFIRSGIKKRKEIIRDSIRDVEPFYTAIEMKRFKLEDLQKELIRNGIQRFNSPSGLHELEVIFIEWGVYSGLFKKHEEEYVLVA